VPALGLVVLVLLGLGVAAASRLDVAGTGVASGVGVVARCQDDLAATPVHTYEADGFRVTAVRVVDGSGTCAGAHVDVRLLAADGALLATARGVVDGAVDLPLDTALDPTAAHRTSLVVAGAA